MIRVYADMVADLFHYGHIEFLRRVSALGDYVLVGINADDVAEVHKRRPMQTMEERIASVAACQYVDQVIPHAPWVFDPTWIEKYGTCTRFPSKEASSGRSLIRKASQPPKLLVAENSPSSNGTPDPYCVKAVGPHQ
jgi:cytidyltransferase-like protein